MNETTSLPEWLRRSAAGAISILICTSLLYRYEIGLVSKLLAVPISFLMGYIAYSPIPFFAAFPEAWRRARNWKADKLSSPQRDIAGCLMMAIGINGVLFALLVSLSEVLHWTGAEEMRTPTLRTFIASVLFASFLSVAAGMQGAVPISPREYIELKAAARRFNIFVAPFTMAFYFLWGLSEVALVAPKVIYAVMEFLTISLPDFILGFLPRFCRAWAKLTASHGRLSTGLIAALGTTLCVVREWPPMPGCLIGFVIGLTLWATAKLALLCWPEPEVKPIIA